MTRVLHGPSAHTLPDGLPFLSAGKHKRPTQGACLMEYVSVLAGRRFSAKPACTDRTLAAIARAVNDYSSDEARQRLTQYAGALAAAGRLSLTDQQDLARRVLLTAMPHATGTRRRTLLVALFGLERAAAGRTHDVDEVTLHLDTELALLGGAGDLDRARRMVAELPVAVRQYQRRGMAIAVEFAIAMIADEAPDSDAVLFALLGACLDDHRRVQLPSLVPGQARAPMGAPNRAR
ncbi:MAG TPA: hypothetical protein VHW92_01730 [Mycobacteriales bacterium]|nr:hypothetical protein [Mycobacteriales bacterium]